MTHGDLVNACLLVLTEEGALAWKHATGVGKVGEEGEERYIRFGLKGSSDIMAGVPIGDPPIGHLLCVECKVQGQPLSPKQKLWRRAVLRIGGLHFLARDNTVGLRAYLRLIMRRSA